MADEFEGVSLMDFLSLDTTGMEAKQRGEILPKLFGNFECVKAEVEEVKDGDKTKGFLMKSEWKLAGIINLLDKTDSTGSKIEEEKLIGKPHYENKFVNNPQGIQYTLGFLESCGLKERGQIGAVWKKLEGVKISALIKHRKDANDTSKVYSEFDKIKVIA